MLNEKYFGSIIDSFIKCQPEYKKYPLEKSEYWDVHWREKGHLYNLLNKTDPNVQKRNLPIIINYLENFRFNSNLSKNLDDSYMNLPKDKSNYIHYSFINGILNSSDSIGKEFVWENADSINVGNNNTSILLNGTLSIFLVLGVETSRFSISNPLFITISLSGFLFESTIPFKSINTFSICPDLNLAGIEFG